MARFSDHAIQRYCERVENISEAEARDILRGSEKAVDVAAAFGCGTVKLGNGARLKLRGSTVCTIIGKRQ